VLADRHKRESTLLRPACRVDLRQIVARTDTLWYLTNANDLDLHVIAWCVLSCWLLVVLLVQRTLSRRGVLAATGCCIGKS
jgi:hypothetical protein